MNIIALDDEASALKVLERAIKRTQPNAQFACFSKPEDALAFARENTVDVVFLDVQMPGMTGIEVAERLEAIDPDINIIFTTGYDQYALDALKLHASGYLMKPVSAADVAEELGHLRVPERSADAGPKVFVQTFGNFAVFVDGVPVVFKRSKSLELFAYLVDRRGASVNKREIAAALFGDDYSPQVQNYLGKIYRDMMNGFEEAGVGGIVIKSYNSYAANMNAFACDLMEYLNGDEKARAGFNGEYMVQFEWAEGCFLG